MEIPIFLIACVMGLAAAWLCQMSLERWRIAAKAEGGPRGRRAEIIAKCAIVPVSLLAYSPRSLACGGGWPELRRLNDP